MYAKILHLFGLRGCLRSAPQDGPRKQFVFAALLTYNLTRGRKR